MVYKKKKSSGNRMDLLNSQKKGGHHYHARHGAKNDTSLNSLILSDEPQKKIYAKGGVQHKAMDDPEFNTALDKYSKQYGINKDWVNRLIQLESGGEADPSKTHPRKDTTASGMFQFIESTARKQGTTGEALRKMSATEQLPYAFKYWDTFKGRIKQPSDLYVAHFYPKALGKSDDYILGGDDPESRQHILRGNKAMDKEGKGYINVRDVRKWFDPNYQSKFEQPMVMPRIQTAVADKTYRALPGKSDLFPIQRTTLPSLEKKVPIKYNEGIRPASEGMPQQDIETSDLMELYNDPGLSENPDFVQKLFSKKS